MNDNKFGDWNVQYKNRFHFLFSLPAIIWPLLFLCVPLVGLILSSCLSVNALQKYGQVLTIDHARIIIRSLLLGFHVAFCSLLCVYPVAYFIAIIARRWKRYLLFFLMVPLWTNFLVQIYGWQFIIERNGVVNLILQKLLYVVSPINFSDSILTVGLVMVYCYIPFMFIPIYSVLVSFDKRLLEASADLGASGLQTFMRITLPLSISGVRAGLLLTFVLGYTEFAIPAVIGGGKFMTVGSLITYYFLIVGDSVLAVSFICISGAALCIGAVLLSKSIEWLFKQYRVLHDDQKF